MTPADYILVGFIGYIWGILMAWPRVYKHRHYRRTRLTIDPWDSPMIRFEHETAPVLSHSYQLLLQRIGRNQQGEER